MDSLPVDQAAVEQEAGEPLKTRRIQHKHGRAKLPEALPRIPIEHDLKPEAKLCPCCGQERCRIGKEVTEQLEHFPASFKVLQHIRYKYACKACENNGHGPQIELAEKPAQPIEKGLPGPGLLAHVITSKLGDHLPLYRLERIFARHDVHIARSTMCAWMLATGELVQPLVDLMGQRVRESRVIHTDDTRVPVQDETEEGRCKSGRIWTYIGDRDHPYIVYDYTPDRTRAGPSRWLDQFRGYLQADAYGGYDGIYATGVKEVACWAHGRRHFFDAKDTDARRARPDACPGAGTLRGGRRGQRADRRDHGHHARAGRRHPPGPAAGPERADAGDDQDVAGHRAEAGPAAQPDGRAIGYMLNQWDALCIYTTRASSTSTTTPPNAPCGGWGSEGRTGCSPGMMSPPNEPPRFTASSLPPNAMAWIPNVTSPACWPASPPPR